MISLGKSFQYKGKPVKLSAHEFITLLKIRMSSPTGISGYRLISDLAKIFAGSWAPQSGTIYPILKRLADIKRLIIEKEEKTPIGPVAKVYHVKDDVAKVLDEMVLANYKQDLKFFGNYIEFLAENLEKSVKSGLIPGHIVTGMQDELTLLVKKIEDVQENLETLQDLDPNAIYNCPKCGSEIDRVSRFCPNCGSELVASGKKEN